MCRSVSESCSMFYGGAEVVHGSPSSQNKKTTLWDMLFQENNQLQGVNTLCFIALNI